MELVDNKIVGWETIKNQYPDEWVVILNPTFEGMQIISGIVVSHHQDKRVASIECVERREGLKKFTITYTGKIKSNYHIGLLSTIKNTF